MDDRNNQPPITKASALRYAAAWAGVVHADTATLTNTPDGDFYGQLGSVAFEYLAASHTLVARAVVAPFSGALARRPDVIAELKRIERAEPQTVALAAFDYVLGRWQSRHEPALYLRYDFSRQSLSEHEFVEKMKVLRDTAYLWNRNKFTEVLDRLNRALRK